MSICLDEEKLFIREFERKDGNEIKVKQCSVGDVGCVVWDAAIVLASYIETPDFKNSSALSGKSVIELGAGTGLVGLNACCEGANVIITDLKDFIPLMELNIKENKEILKGNVAAQELQWGSNVADFTKSIPDFVFLADCVYYEESVEPLVQTIGDLSGPDTTVICCYEDRLTGNKPELQKKFFQMIGDKFAVEEIPLESQDPVYRSEDIHIMKFKKKT